MREVKAVALVNHNSWTSQIIQCFVHKEVEPPEPDQASDPNLELSWSRVTESPNGFRLHQRLYCPKGTGPIPDQIIESNELYSKEWVEVQRSSQEKPFRVRCPDPRSL